MADKFGFVIRFFGLESDRNGKRQNTTGPATVKFVHMQDVTGYKWEFQSRTPELRERFTDWSIARYYNKTEIEFRGKSIEGTRGELKYPFPPSLNLSVATNPALWSKYDSLLMEFEIYKPKKNTQPIQQGSPQQHIPDLLAIANAPHDAGGGHGSGAPPPKGKGKGNKFARTREAKSGGEHCA